MLNASSYNGAGIDKATIDGAVTEKAQPVWPAILVCEDYPQPPAVTAGVDRPGKTELSS